MKKKTKIIIAIIVVIIIYFVKFKTYKINFDKSERQDVLYLDIRHRDEEGEWDQVVRLLDIQNMDDKELQREIIDTVSNLKLKFKKITFTNRTITVGVIAIDRDFSLAQSLIHTDDYSIDILLATDSMEYSHLYVEKYEGFYRVEYEFEEESFNALNNLIKHIVCFKNKHNINIQTKKDDRQVIFFCTLFCISIFISSSSPTSIRIRTLSSSSTRVITS